MCEGRPVIDVADGRLDILHARPLGDDLAMIVDDSVLLGFREPDASPSSPFRWRARWRTSRPHMPI
ncbi:MAG: hypothetical protein HPM95_16805 [Alphaproteobacteria bacterium]|nr:hypothetical protein [Alphaproteobacteria bacterium]